MMNTNQTKTNNIIQLVQELSDKISELENEIEKKDSKVANLELENKDLKNEIFQLRETLLGKCTEEVDDEKKEKVERGGFLGGMKIDERGENELDEVVSGSVKLLKLKYLFHQNPTFDLVGESSKTADLKNPEAFIPVVPIEPLKKHICLLGGSASYTKEKRQEFNENGIVLVKDFTLKERIHPNLRSAKEVKKILDDSGWKHVKPRDGYRCTGFLAPKELSSQQIYDKIISLLT